MKRIAWGITGAGDLIRETYETMVDIKKRAHQEFMVFLSVEAKSVLTSLVPNFRRMRSGLTALNRWKDFINLK